jgi:cyclic pyranopterin phosphate synthase
MIYDHYGRPLNSLRIQLNATCNFKCFFCHMEGTETNGEFLTPEEIEKVVKVAADNGVNRVKLTGGEPLLRKDLEEIIGRIRAHIDGDISLTTNAFFLNGRARSLKDSGLNRINISLHSVDRDKFKEITGIDAINRVKEGIEDAARSGLNPIKINFVVLKDLNDDQVDSMIEFTSKNGLVLQLIEYETDRAGEKSDTFQKYHYDLRKIEERLNDRVLKVEHNSLHNREKFYVSTDSGSIAVVEFVRPQRNADFCNHCTRLRITSRGEFQTCLNRRDQVFSFRGKDEGGIFNVYREAVMARVPYWREADESSY